MTCESASASPVSAAPALPCDQLHWRPVRCNPERAPADTRAAETPPTSPLPRALSLRFPNRAEDPRLLRQMNPALSTNIPRHSPGLPPPKTTPAHESADTASYFPAASAVAQRAPL